MQIDLFGKREKSKTDISIELSKEINGLELYPNFINDDEQKQLLYSIDSSCGCMI